MTGGVTSAPAEQAAARRNERELDHFPIWAGGRDSARVGIKSAEGRPLILKEPVLAIPSLLVCPNLLRQRHEEYNE